MELKIGMPVYVSNISSAVKVYGTITNIDGGKLTVTTPHGTQITTGFVFVRPVQTEEDKAEYNKYLAMAHEVALISRHPPNEIKDIDKKDRLSVFLAGSIEMGVAVDWQKKVIEELYGYKAILLNPRRPDWDSSWTQSVDNPNFFGQVDWEHRHLEMADMIIMYFDPNTKSPITLMELGLFADSGKLVVCCPEGYWRKGNVDYICQHYNIPTVDNLDDLIKEVQKRCAHKLDLMS